MELINPFADKLKIKGQENYQAFPDSESQYCLRCGAWYGELGLEPTPELYVANMVAVFREVRRVLRSDGTVWLNLGDSYASNTKQTGRNDADNEFRPGRNESGNKTRINVSLDGLKPKDLCGIPWRVAFALQADGWWLRSDIIWCLSGGG